MDLNLPIMGASDTPIYKQVFDGIAAQILCGSLPGGTCLPPIRTIAAQLGISVITIKRAWEELERSGLITTNVGRGCFVAQLTEQKRNEMRMEIAQAEVKKLMPLFRLLGLTAEEAVFMIKKEYSRYPAVGRKIRQEFSLRLIANCRLWMFHDMSNIFMNCCTNDSS